MLCLGVVNNRYSFAFFFLSAKAIAAREAAQAKSLIFLQGRAYQCVKFDRFFSPSTEVGKVNGRKKIR